MAIVATAACPPSLKGPLTAGPADTRPPRLQRALAAASGGVSGYGGGDVPDLPPWPGLGGVAGDTGRPWTGLSRAMEYRNDGLLTDFRSVVPDMLYSGGSE